MEGHNTTTILDRFWTDLIPSTRVFLTSVVLFLLLAILLMLVKLLFLRVLHTLWPRPTPTVQTTYEIELTAMIGETSRAEGSQNSNTRVQSSGSGNQTTRKRITLSCTGLAVKQRQRGAVLAAKKRRQGAVLAAKWRQRGAVQAARQRQQGEVMSAKQKPEDKASRSDKPEKAIRTVDKAKEEEKLLRELQRMKEAIKVLTDHQCSHPSPSPAGKSGHKSGKSGYKSGRSCYNCGEKLHYASSCPHPWSPDGRSKLHSP